MDIRRGKRNRFNDDKVGVEEEMEKWQQVADMIGGTLDDVCNMAEGERRQLVLLISAEKSLKDNIDPAKNDEVNDVLLASSESEDDLYRKADVYSHTNVQERQASEPSPKKVYSHTNAQKRQASEPSPKKVYSHTNDQERQASAEPSLKKVKVMMERCDVELVDLTSVSNDSAQSSSFNSSPVQNSTATLDDETEMMSPIFKKRSKNNSLKSTDGKGVTVNEHEENYEYERKCLNVIFQKVLPWCSNKKLNNAHFVEGTLQPIVSNTEYFEAMDKHPQKYKLDKQVPGSVSLEKTASATIEGIYKGFEGIKFMKSQGVYTGKECPGLVSVATDSSVREGLAALKPKRRRDLESGSVRPEGSVNESTRFTRTTRNSINASSDYFDDMFDTGAHDSADDFEVEDNDYLEEIERNKKGKAKSKRPRIIKSDSDDDFKVDDRDVKTDKKTKNPTSGTRRNPPGLGENNLGGKDNRKATRGRGKGNVAENNIKDGSQTSMLNFVGSKRIENLNANEKLGSYDPMSHLVKSGGDQGKASSPASGRHHPFSNSVKLGVGRSNTSSVDIVIENSHDSMPHSANLGADRSHQKSSRGNVGAGRRSSTLSTVERKVVKTNEDKFKGKTGTCPLCLKVQWQTQLAKHAAECSGDAQGTGTRELCSGCLELIPAEAFKDHTLGCNTD